jgi:hypothetical protein
MTGIVLIIIGIIGLTVGILFLSTGNKVVPTDRENNIEEAINIVSTDKENSIEDMINIAVSDGHLSENEKKELRRHAKEKSLDADKIVALAEEKLKTFDSKKEVEKIDYNKKNGNDFEGYVVKKFDEKYFTIKNWRSDKYIDGRYAEDNPAPDLLLDFNLKDKSYLLAVECKWRSKYYNNGFDMNEKDLAKYQQYEQTKKIPVFIVIGIGGTGSNPEKLYAVKLSSVKHSFLNESFLSKIEKKEKDRNFYFDTEKLILK